MNYWLIKSEPNTYSFENLRKDKKTHWDGVRNYQARNNMRKMKKGEPVLFYHSGKEPALIGLAQVVKEAHHDFTATAGDWDIVEIAYKKSLKHPVKLSKVKAVQKLAKMQLVTHSRLSVQVVKKSEFDEILKISHNQA
jgi:predicted RNA-binding protein with PUA-like domain